MPDVTFAGGAFLVLGVLLVRTARRSVRADVDHRRGPGLRTPGTLRSRESWLAAHRRTAPALRGSGVSLVVAGAAWLAAGAAGWTPASELVVVLPALVLMPVLVHVVIVGSRAAAEAEDR